MVWLWHQHKYKSIIRISYLYLIQRTVPPNKRFIDTQYQHNGKDNRNGIIGLGVRCISPSIWSSWEAFCIVIWKVSTIMLNSLRYLKQPVLIENCTSGLKMILFNFYLPNCQELIQIQLDSKRHLPWQFQACVCLTNKAGPPPPNSINRGPCSGE